MAARSTKTQREGPPFLIRRLQQLTDLTRELSWSIFRVRHERGNVNGKPYKSFKTCLRRARHSFVDISGEATWVQRDDVYRIVKERVRQQAGPVFEFFTGPPEAKHRKKFVKKLTRYAKLGVPIWVLPKRPPIHFSVIDQRHTRVEEKHPKGVLVRDQIISWHNPMVHTYQEHVERLRSAAIPFEDFASGPPSEDEDLEPGMTPSQEIPDRIIVTDVDTLVKALEAAGAKITIQLPNPPTA